MSGLTLRKWNSAQHLKTKEDMAQYLEACLQEAGDDAAFIAKARGNIARAKGMSQLRAMTVRCWSKERPSKRSLMVHSELEWTHQMEQAMAINVKLSESLVESAKRYGTIEHRSVPKQIEYWSQIGKIAAENPDLPFSVIRDILIAYQEDPGGEYQFG